MRAPQIAVTELGRQVEIGRGGQGVVYALPDFRRGRHRHMVYKEYHPEVRAELDVVALDRVVDFVSGHSGSAGKREAWLLPRAAWPTALVVGSAAVCGVLMQRIPQAFMLDIAVAGRMRRRPAGMEYLLNPPDYVTRLGLFLTRRQRVGLLADLARTLRMLHGSGVAVGDLSPRNVLFDPEAPTHTLLLDCDTTTVDGVTPLPRMETPDWEAPGRRAGRPDDVHKFALLVIRMLTGNQTARDPAALAVAVLGLTNLAERSLCTGPAERPTMDEWSGALEALLNRDRRASETRVWKRRSFVLACAGLALLGSTYSVALAAQAARRGSLVQPERTRGIDRYRNAIDLTAIADDRRTPAVAAVLDAYFAAITDNRPDDALALFDPANRLNPVTPARRRAFTAAVAARVNSRVRVLRLSPGRPSPGPLAVHLTYTSAPRSLPAGASVLCWRGTYTLVMSERGYRILNIRRSPGRCAQ
jgi:hypothetical protein